MDSQRLGSQTIRESVYTSAIQGVVVWSVYAVVECFFSSILPWMIKPGYTYTPVHWGFTALLFGIYPTIGLLLGGMLGLVAHVAAKRIPLLQKMQVAIVYPVGATLTLIMAFTVNFVVNYYALGEFGLSELPPLSFSLLLTLGLLLSAGSSMWFSRLRFLTNPWTASIVLLGLPWINKELLGSSGMVAKAGWALAYPIAIFLISFIVQRMIKKRRIDISTVSTSIFPVKYFAFLTFCVFGVSGISFFLDQEPILIQNLESSLKSAAHSNVILITMDTVRADHLSLYGYERDTTPNLKKFSQEATLYTLAIASSDWTLPTHASIFTGMYARRHGAHNTQGALLGLPLAKRFHTLAEILSEKGYLTMGIVANIAYLTRRFQMDQGFQYYDQRAPVVFLKGTQPYYLRQGIRNVLLVRFVSRASFDQVTRRAEEINREVLTILDKVKEDRKPFFLFVNYMDAHQPYIPPPPFDALYPGKDERFTSARHSALFKEVMKRERKMTEKEHHHLVSQYDGGIAYIDAQIGKFIERLKSLGLYKNSLIIITSDHGEAFGERDLVEHGVSVYQDQVFVPLIVKYPNNNKGEVVDEVVSSVDLMPTILDVLGYETPEVVKGKSLLKLERENPREVISESFPKWQFTHWHPRFHRVERAIFSGPFKFISSTKGKRELYDLSKDPDEKENLYKADDNISRELEAKLNQWLETTVAETETPAKVKLDQDTLNRLKTLGYIQ